LPVRSEAESLEASCRIPSSGPAISAPESIQVITRSIGTPRANTTSTVRRAAALASAGPEPGTERASWICPGRKTRSRRRMAASTSSEPSRMAPLSPSLERRRVNGQRL
jgi:hypothetical protein